MITGEKIEGKLSFVSKSASPQTKTFRVESEISNPLGAIKDGVTSTITIQTDAILSHKISPSILDLDDSGNIGVKVLDSENIIRFVPIYIVEDLEFIQKIEDSKLSILHQPNAKVNWIISFEFFKIRYDLA